jgi:hypothetical protein
MKIDVEGFELEVLQGAQVLLQKRNVWWVACARSHACCCYKMLQHMMLVLDGRCSTSAVSKQLLSVGCNMGRAVGTVTEMLLLLLRSAVLLLLAVRAHHDSSSSFDPFQP